MQHNGNDSDALTQIRESLYCPVSALPLYDPVHFEYKDGGFSANLYNAPVLEMMLKTLPASDTERRVFDPCTRLELSKKIFQSVQVKNLVKLVFTSEELLDARNAMTQRVNTLSLLGFTRESAICLEDTD